jgi:hypothetical protein
MYYSTGCAHAPHHAARAWADKHQGNKAPYAFTGTVKKVVFDLRPATLEDEQALHEHAQIQAVGGGAAG